VVSVLLSAGASTEVQTEVRSDKGSTRVEFISFVFRMEGLLFTLLVLKVLWEWSLSCWQLGLTLTVEIRSRLSSIRLCFDLLLSSVSKDSTPHGQECRSRLCALESWSWNRNSR
jgi:hypothetical protein